MPRNDNTSSNKNETANPYEPSSAIPYQLAQDTDPVKYVRVINYTAIGATIDGVAGVYYKGELIPADKFHENEIARLQSIGALEDVDGNDVPGTVSVIPAADTTTATATVPILGGAGPGNEQQQQQQQQPPVV